MTTTIYRIANEQIILENLTLVTEELKEAIIEAIINDLQQELSFGRRHIGLISRMQNITWDNVLIIIRYGFLWSETKEKYEFWTRLVERMELNKKNGNLDEADYARKKLELNRNITL